MFYKIILITLTSIFLTCSDTTDNTINISTQDSTQDSIQDSIKNTSQDTSQDSTGDSIEDIIQDTVPDSIIVIVDDSLNSEQTNMRIFSTSFEAVEDFEGFYISPTSYLETSFHKQSDSIVHSGNFSHKAWINGANEPSTKTINNNHRGYPTVQLYKREDGSFQTPCVITLWVWLDISLQKDQLASEDDWFSFATFSDDTTDNWGRTVLVNLSHEGFVHLQHTTAQEKNDIIFQTNSIAFPQKQWVELKIYLDFRGDGYAKVWQNGELVSHANVSNVQNRLAQAHFGMYCPPQLTSGTVYNDDLSIEMVSGE